MKEEYDEQMGFRPHPRTSHQAVRRTTIIQKAKNSFQKTGVVFLDIAKAFDKIWHDGLILKMLYHHLPLYQVNLIDSFLRNRSLQVSVDTGV